MPNNIGPERHSNGQFGPGNKGRPKRLPDKPPSVPKPGDNRRANGQFGPGNKGRPPGIVQRKTLEIKEVARQIILGEFPEKSIAAMARRVRSGKAEHLEKFFLEHLYGKPKEHIDIHMTQEHIYAVMALSDLMLAEFLSLLREKRHEEALKLLPGGHVA